MRFWFRRSREERELDEEMKFHLSQETELRIDRGQSPDAARQSARRDFGNIALAKEVTRDIWGWNALDRAAQDFRFAWRMLIKNKAFTAVAVLALTLGIGATTAVFSVVYTVLLRPLPFPEPERLVMAWEVQPSGRPNVVQTQNFLDWRRRSHSFEDFAALLQAPVNLSGDGDPIQFPGLRVTEGFFSILGVPPLLGRAFRAAEHVSGGPSVIILSHGLWQRRFGSRPDIVGRRIQVNGAACEIIGVTPPGFGFPNQTAGAFVPAQIDPAAAPQQGRNYRTVARLKRGVSVQSATAEMQSIAAQLAGERPRMNARWSAKVIPLLDQTVGDSRRMLLVVFGAVAFVLLIACANVSNLLLMRASARRREMTLRVALGAGRFRLLHQLTIESLTLAVTGGLLGFALAWWGVPALIGLLPEGFSLPRVDEIVVDYRILAFTMLVSIGCGLFFGIFPAMQVDRGSVSTGLRLGGRTGTSGNRRVRNVLVVAEIGLAVLLVIGAGLMLRSFLRLHQTDPGFRPDRLVSFRMFFMPAKYTDSQRRAAATQQILDRVRALPMIAGAGTIHLLPLSGAQSGSGYYRTDRPVPAPGSGSTADISVISDDYFRTMGIAMVAGREFDKRDRLGAPPVLILNRAAAQEIFPNENPIGKRLNVSWQGPPESEVIGVSADIRHNGLEHDAYPTIFLPNGQRPNLFTFLLVRTRGDNASAIAAVRQQIREADPDQGVSDIKTMTDVMADSIARPRIQAALLGVFGMVALALACLGIYAVVSYSVEQRSREMGVRLALGAAPASILGMVLREGLLLAAAGIVVGVVASLALTRYLETMLFAIRATDPQVYVTVCAILAASAAAGCYFPASRATRVDPAVVLREE